MKKKYQPKDRHELKSLCDNLDICLGDIDTSKIIDMRGIFQSSKRTNEQFAGIETWCVSQVFNMAFMFWGSKIDYPLDSWCVSNVVNMSNMFELTPFNKPLSSWNPCNVAVMDFMFNGFAFNQDITMWKTPKLKSAVSFFCNRIEAIERAIKEEIKECNDVSLVFCERPCEYMLMFKNYYFFPLRDATPILKKECKKIVSMVLSNPAKYAFSHYFSHIVV